MSELQKKILAIACERRGARDLDAERVEGEQTLSKYGMASLYQVAPDVYYPELLSEIWGFPHSRLFPAERKAKFGETIRGSGWWGQYFDRDTIGREEYNGATTTLWRAAKRLEDRGLAIRAFYGKPGVFLTDKGLEVARTLLVETPQR